MNFLRRLALQGGRGLDDSSRLDVVEIARVTSHASFKPLLLEKTCSLAHEQTPLSNDTIDSVLRHREVGRIKDLSAPSRILHRELIKIVTIPSRLTDGWGSGLTSRWMALE